MDFRTGIIIALAVIFGVAYGRWRSRNGGNSSAAPSQPARPRTPAREPGPYQVRLTDAGPNKIGVIKEVRAATGLGLKESKDLTDATPSIVASGLSRAAAEDLVEALRNAKGQAEIV